MPLVTGEDYKSTLEAASGSLSIPSGTVYSSQANVGGTTTFTLASGAVVARKVADPVTYDDSTDAVVRASSGSTITWDGGTIDARGGHNGILQLNGAGTLTIKNCTVRNASYKQINLNGNAVVENVRVESNRTIGRSMAMQADWEGNIADTVTVNGLTIGMFYNSREGQSTKWVRVDTLRLTDIQVPQIDEDTWYGVIFGEEVNYAIVKDSTIPRKVTHFPDSSGGADTIVNLLVISNCTIGNDDEAILNLHDGTSGFLARTVVYHKVTFKNAGSVCLKDATPTTDLVARYFLGCTFNTAGTSTLISHASGASALLGRIKHAGCTFEGTWNKPSDWAASEVTLPTGLNIDDFAEIFA